MLKCRRENCENEGRYSSGYCGVCDITLNDGKGIRIEDNMNEVIEKSLAQFRNFWASRANGEDQHAHLLNLSLLQYQLHQWQDRCFGEQPTERPVLGANEEMGELFGAFEHMFSVGLNLSKSMAAVGRLDRALLKRAQSIRGFDNEGKFLAETGDAIADAVVYLMQVCTHLGLDFGVLLSQTAAQVMKRDWVAHPVHAAEVAAKG
jgi:hypothetical protein